MGAYTRQRRRRWSRETWRPYSNSLKETCCPGLPCNSLTYYMEESVLLGTKPLIDYIRHFIRDPRGYFSYVTFMSVQWRHNSHLLLLLNWFLHIIKRTLHGGEKIYMSFIPISFPTLKGRRPEKINMLFTGLGRSVWEKTLPLVLSTARGRRPRAVVKTSGTVFSHTDLPPGK